MCQIFLFLVWVYGLGMCRILFCRIPDSSLPDTGLPDTGQEKMMTGYRIHNNRIPDNNQILPYNNLLETQHFYSLIN